MRAAQEKKDEEKLEGGSNEQGKARNAGGLTGKGWEKGKPYSTVAGETEALYTRCD